MTKDERLANEQRLKEALHGFASLVKSMASCSTALGLAVGAITGFLAETNGLACEDPPFDDADQEILVSLGLTRGW